MMLSCQVLGDLNMPHYHHELVKEAVEAGFDKPGSMAAVARLLRDLSESGNISSTQLAQVGGWWGQDGEGRCIT
jgi:hypothetical protein